MKHILLPETTADVLGLFLRDVLSARRMTQTEFAARIGVSQSMVSRYMRGSNGVTIDMLHRLLTRTEWAMLLDRLDAFAAHQPGETS